jgi:hypothetical protein
MFMHDAITGVDDSPSEHVFSDAAGGPGGHLDSDVKPFDVEDLKKISAVCSQFLDALRGGSI